MADEPDQDEVEQHYESAASTAFDIAMLALTAWIIFANLLLGG